MRLAREHGETADDLDPEREAVALFALVDGLVSHVLIGHYTPAAALSAVDHHLDHLFRDTQTT